MYETKGELYNLDRIVSDDGNVWATLYSDGWQLYDTRDGATAGNLTKADAEVYIRDYESEQRRTS